MIISRRRSFMRLGEPRTSVANVHLEAISVWLARKQSFETQKLNLLALLAGAARCQI